MATSGITWFIFFQVQQSKHRKVSSYMSSICGVWHAAFHLSWRGQQFNFFCKRQRGNMRSFLFSHYVIQNSTKNQEQTRCSMSANRWLSVHDYLNRVREFCVFFLQRGLILLVIQLPPQLLICQLEILEQRKMIRQQNTLQQLKTSRPSSDSSQ